MGKLATTASLSNYPKLRIASYRDELKQDSKALKLAYSYCGKDYQYKIRLDKTPCHYGNYRYWFICPHCGKRAGVLYCAGAFVCRHCLNANYATQLMQPIDKLFRKVEKIRHRLQWQAGIAHGHGAKPKGMHYKTYFKLVWEHDRLVNAICGATMQRLDKHHKRT